MTLIRLRIATAQAALLACVLIAGSAFGQDTYTWQNTGTGDWNATGVNYNWDDPLNIGGSPIPDGTFNEDAVIDNGGTAQVSTVFNNSILGLRGPGALTINNDSTLEVLSGGFFTTEPSGADVAGNVVAGLGSATGTIIVNNGGSLAANGNLSIFGSGSSSLTLSGNASATSTGTASLHRVLNVSGPDVTLSANIVDLGGGTQYNATIVGATHSVIEATTSLDLSGALNVDLSAATGSSWDLFEAPSITGAFASVSITGGDFLPGQFATLETTEVGAGLMRTTLALDALVYAEVDTDSGAITLKKSDGVAVAVDGYSLTSDLGALNPNYTSPFDQATGDWIEVVSTANHLAGVEIEGSSAISDTLSLELPGAFAQVSAPLGTSLADVAFTYATPSGEVVQGEVVYVGNGVSSLSNDVVLIVDADGNTQLQNASGEPVAIEGYVIETAEGEIDTTGWTSLMDQTVDGWVEAAASANLLSEVDINHVINLATRSGFNLGDLFTGEIPTDLTFSYLLEGGVETTPGTVLFIDNVTLAGLEGDFNDDGVVDAADYTIWRDNLGASEALLAAGGNGDGVIDIVDYQRWKANFGATADTFGSGALTATPEPSTLLLMLASCVAAAIGRRA